MNNTQQWAPLMYIQNDGNVLDFSDNYKISDDGVVIKSSTGIVMKTSIQDHLPVNYEVVRIGHTLGDGEYVKRRLRIHRAILSSFFPINPLFGNLDVAHIDKDSMNNRLSNLCWMNRVHNVEHGRQDGDVVVSEEDRIGVFLTRIPGSV